MVLDGCTSRAMLCITHQSSRVDTSTAGSFTYSVAFQVGGLLLYLVYFVWLGLLIERTMRRVRQMNVEYIFVTVITLVTILGAMAAIFMGAFAPDQVFTVVYLPQLKASVLGSTVELHIVVCRLVHRLTGYSSACSTQEDIRRVSEPLSVQLSVLS